MSCTVLCHRCGTLESAFYLRNGGGWSHCDSCFAFYKYPPPPCQNNTRRCFRQILGCFGILVLFSQAWGGGGATTVKQPRQQPAQPQYANYWAPLTRKRHTMPHPEQPQHTNHWAPRTRKRHQQEHRPQRPTESSDPMQYAKGRRGNCPGPRKETTTRRNVTQGVTKMSKGLKPKK